MTKKPKLDAETIMWAACQLSREQQHLAEQARKQADKGWYERAHELQVTASGLAYWSDVFRGEATRLSRKGKR